MTKHVKYLVVGAGITGLTIANELAATGVSGDDLLVLEANDRPGGLIKTDTIDGYTTEWGPEGLRGNSEHTQRIFELTGAEGIPVSEESKIRYIGKGDNLVKVPSGPMSAISTGLMPFSGKLRVLKEPFVKANPDDETVAQFIQRRLGKHAVPLVDAFVTGVFGGDPNQLSIRYAFPAMKRLEVEYGSLLRGGMKSAKQKKAQKKTAGIVDEEPKEKAPFLLTSKAGMQGIINSLSQNVEVKLNTKVEQVSLTNGTTSVHTSDGDFTCEHIILATGVNALQKIDLVAEDKLPPPPTVDEAHVAVVTLGFDPDSFEEDVVGYGFLIPDSEERFLMGTLFSSRLFAFRAPNDKIMLRCFVGGYRHPDRPEMDKDKIVEHILDDLNDYLGVKKAPIFAKVQSHSPRGIPQLMLDHDEVLIWRTKTEEKYPQIRFTGIGWSGIACDALIKEARQVSQSLLHN